MGEIRGGMMTDAIGDCSLETAALLTIIMIAIDIYSWWVKQRSLGVVLSPKAGRGHSWWRNLHDTFGSWVSLTSLLFCLSGIA